MLKPTIDPSVYISKGAVVLGNVTIAKDCSIWYHAAIRIIDAPISIGAGALIPQNKIIPDNSLVIGSPGKIIPIFTHKKSPEPSGLLKRRQPDLNW